MKIVIVGVTKCGTSSLELWLRSKGHYVVNHQTLATLSSGTLIFQNHYKGYVPALIFRNYEDRMKSFYAFYTDYGGSVKHSKGQTDKYDRMNIIAQWRSYDPLIFTLEDLRLDPTFPLINVGERLI